MAVAIRLLSIVNQDCLDGLQIYITLKGGHGFSLSLVVLRKRLPCPPHPLTLKLMRKGLRPAHTTHNRDAIFRIRLLPQTRIHVVKRWRPHGMRYN
jgi:hypothetical protein